MVLIFISGEDLASYMRWHKQSIATNSAVCHDKVVNQQFAACSGSPHDDDHLTSLSKS